MAETPPIGREFTITRVFDAPRELVWKAWTDPEHVARWFGPRGFTTPLSTINMDVRTVARSALTMVSDDDGKEYPAGGTFFEVVDIGDQNRGSGVASRNASIMGKIVVTEFVSTDGIIEDPGGSEDYEHGGWSFQFDRGEEGDGFKLDETAASDALLLGRVTYQGFADSWPSREGEFADKFNSMPKYVVSTTLDKPEWQNSTVISGDVAAEVGKLKKQFDNDVVVHGSAQLVNTLKEHDLVDEYRLMVFPVVLGMGKRLFGDGGDLTPPKLSDLKQIGSDGVIILAYQRAPK